MFYDVKKTAEIIKNLRKEKGCTQERVAEETQLNIKTYRAAEQGIRGLSIDSLCVLASFYSVSLDYLISGERESRTDWDRLLEKLTGGQKEQLFKIASDMIHTLGWG